MLVKLVSIFLLLLLNEAGGALLPPERSYKILMLVPSASTSHRNVFMPLADALSDRGHEVTMLSNHHLKKPNPKINYLKHGILDLPEFANFREENINVFELFKDEMQMFKNMREFLSNVAKIIHDDPIVDSLYRRLDEFDLLIFDGLFSEALYPFAHNRTFILLSTEGLNPRLSAAMGNVLNPAYSPNPLFDFPQPYSFSDRVKNLALSILLPLYWDYSIISPQQAEILKRFPELPSLMEIETNASLNLMNSHFSFGKIAPILPNQVEVGCMQCRQPEPLPKHLEKFLEGNAPVIYMSLGSIARSTTIPPEHKKTILETFSNLPYKVLWKYEDDTLGKLPDNILIDKWLPQQDVLAHRNVKVFISHCGLLGFQEAMYHGTPMIGMPIGADQKRNAENVKNQGLGLVVNWKELTQERLTAAIEEVLKNPKYTDNMLSISTVFRDQMESPVERAVYWTEYVIRHKGAVHLRSPELDLSWVQLLHLDILFLVHLTMFFFIKLMKKVVRMFGRRERVKKVKKN